MNTSMLPVQDLRSRAEARLTKYPAVNNSSLDDGQQLQELRIKQVEIELLNEEFGRLRQKISTDHFQRHMQGRFRSGYVFLDQHGQICKTRYEAENEEHADAQTGQFMQDYLSSGEQAKFHDFLQAVFRSDCKVSCELVFKYNAEKNINGLMLPKFAHIEGISDDEKQLSLIVVEDISSQKITEERRKSSSAALAVLNKTIAASRNEIFLFDAKSLKFTFANQRALKNVGYTMDELRQLTPADILTSCDELNKLVAYLFRHKKSVRKCHAVHKRQDGSLYPVEIYLQFFEYEADSSFIAIVLDVSKLMAVESQLKSIVESANAIIWASDVDFKLVYMSDQVQEIMGYPASQFIGSLMSVLTKTLHDSDRLKLAAGLNRAMKGHKVSNLCCKVMHADGFWRWLSVNMTPNFAIDGKLVQVVGVAHDINARILAEEGLRQLNQQLDSRVQEEILKNQQKDLLLQRQSSLAGMGEMIGNIAHQWRQPINSLGLILSDLEDAAHYGECDLAYMQTAVRKSKNIIQKMSSTIDDFRNFFRADKSLKVFSLMQVTDECLNLVEAAMKSHNINIVVKCAQDVKVIGYENECYQSVMNILSNARDAIVEKNIASGEIVIEIREEGRFGVYTLTDNGGGIPADVLPRIFEPHFTTKEHGVGIGLYMSMISIEKNMKGRIKVDNVGEGTRFSIYLPKKGDGHVSY